MLGLLAYSLCAYVVAAANPRLWPRPALGHASRRDVANSSVDEGDPVRCRRSMPLPRGPRSDRAPRSRLLQHPPNTRTSSHRGGCLGTARRSRGSNTTANRRKPLRATTISARRHRGGRPVPTTCHQNQRRRSGTWPPQKPEDLRKLSGSLRWFGSTLQTVRLSATRVAAAIVTIVALLTMVGTPPASAVPINPPHGRAQPGPNTEMTMSGTGPGQGVAGFIAKPSSTFNPLNGYPTQNPGSDFTRDERGLRRCHPRYVRQRRRRP